MIKITTISRYYMNNHFLITGPHVALFLLWQLLSDKLPECFMGSTVLLKVDKQHRLVVTERDMVNVWVYPC